MNRGMRLSPILIPLIIGSVAISFGQEKKGAKPTTIGVVLSASHPDLEALFSRDIEYVPKGTVASYGIDYFSIGFSAGKMAVRILKGENPGNIPWRPVEKLTLVVNERAAKAQGVVIPPHLLKRADRVIKEELGTQEPRKEK